MKILNLIENTEGAEGCTAEHGLSFYIETEKHRLLMDLGPSASVIGNAEKLGVDAQFQVMDAEDPDFEDESFDVLVTRNLTWTLPNMDKAYREWYRLLCPGGVLVNFDADYCRAAEEEVELPENHAHKLIPDHLQRENEFITMELSAYQMPRPQWDVQLLVEAGFERISVDMGVYRRIYREIDEFYNPVSIFTIAAWK